MSEPMTGDEAVKLLGGLIFNAHQTGMQSAWYEVEPPEDMGHPSPATRAETMSLERSSDVLVTEVFERLTGRKPMPRELSACHTCGEYDEVETALETGGAA